MRKGFTLIELIMVIVILGILAATALPRYFSLATEARVSAAKGALGAIRAAVAMKYAENLAKGTDGYPAAITGALFQDNKVPMEPLSNTNEVTAVTAAPAADGVGWAYQASDGSVWINDKDYVSY